jgi:hypothetical protein
MSQTRAGSAASALAPLRLRPMSLGDILDETFRLYRRHFLTFYLAAAIIDIPVTVLSYGVGIIFPTPSAAGSATNIHPLDTLMIQAYLLSAVSLLADVFKITALIRLTYASALGQPLALAMAFQLSPTRFIDVLRTTFLWGLTLLLLCSTLLGISVAVYRFAGWLIRLPVTVLEKWSGRSALGRSAQLIQGHRWRLLGVFVLVMALEHILGGYALSLWLTLNRVYNQAQALPDTLEKAIHFFFSAVAAPLVAPLLWIALTISYLELRVRKEALDLDSRSRLDGEREGPPTLPANPVDTAPIGRVPGPHA